MSTLLRHLEVDLSINIEEMMYQNKTHVANSIGQLGRIHVRDASIMLSTHLPSYIAKYRVVAAESLEHLYETLHNRFVNDLDSLNRRVEFIFCNELPTKRGGYEKEINKIYLKKLDRDKLETTFEVGFYCQSQECFISNKTFRSSEIFFTSGVATFDEDLETSILKAINYYDYNKPQETLISRCSRIFKSLPKDNMLTSILTNLREKDDNLLTRLGILLPHMQQNQCGTGSMLNEYHSMIQGLVDSFEKIFNVLIMIKHELWQALVDRFDLVPTEQLANTLRYEILDKLSANTQIGQILTCFDGLKYENQSNVQQALNDLDDSFENHGDLKGKHACVCLIRHFVIELVGKFMDTLLRQREKLAEAFNQLEPMLNDIFSSYYLLENRDRFSPGIESRLTQIKSNKNDVKTFADVYIGTIGDIIFWSDQDAVNAQDESVLSQIVEYLKKSSRYFPLIDYQNRLNNLRKLLENYTDPYEIDVSDDQGDDRMTVNAHVKSSILSHLLASIRSSMRRELQPGDELRVINSGRVYLDMDLNEPMFSGVNIVLVGVSFQLVSDIKDTFCVDTNGLNAPPPGTSEQATSGKNGNKSEKDGLCGEDGVDGLPGGHAGNVFIFASELPEPREMQVSACGGNGSDGQIGGNGGDGYDGVGGKSGTKEECKEAFRYSLIGDYTASWKFNYFSGVSWKIGTPGEDGGLQFFDYFN